MSQLEDDIARVAALRGRSAPVPQKRQINGVSLGMLLIMGPDPRRDLQALDDLPEASRRFITTWPRPINSVAWSNMLDEHDGDEQFLIRTFHAYFADVHGVVSPVVRKPRQRRFS